MTRAVLSLGSNLGDRYQRLREAVASLGDELVVISGVYETDPWPPGADAPPYLNAAALAVTNGDDPRHWLKRARELEQAAGRVRDPQRQSHPAGAGSPPELGSALPRYQPRTLDVDVIAVWDAAGDPVLSDDPELTLPHPRAHLRAFVIRPWLDIQPYAQLPGHGWLTELVRADPVASELAQVRPRPDLPLEPGLPPAADSPLESEA